MQGRSGQAKLKLYKTVIRPLLWYASESWTLTKKSESALEASERNVLRRILGPNEGKQYMENWL
jgi:hypothetical protein